MLTVLRKPDPAGHCEGSGGESQPAGEMILLLLDAAGVLMLFEQLGAQRGINPAVQHPVLRQHTGMLCWLALGSRAAPLDCLQGKLPLYLLLLSHSRPPLVDRQRQVVPVLVLSHLAALLAVRLFAGVYWFHAPLEYCMRLFFRPGSVLAPVQTGPKAVQSLLCRN